jgi:hypothetical protein
VVLRGFGPMRAAQFGLRAQVEGTGAGKTCISVLSTLAQGAVRPRLYARPNESTGQQFLSVGGEEWALQDLNL